MISFFKKSSANEIETFLENNNEGYDAQENKNKLKTIIASLHDAAGLLDCSDFEKEADVITTLLTVLANDPATSGLTSEKMLANLANTGWVFNAPKSNVSKKPAKKVVDNSMVKDKKTKPVEEEQELIVEEESVAEESEENIKD